MARVVVVTDSAAALPQRLADEYSIQVVPLLLHWDGTAYRDGIDIAPGEVYRRLRGAPTLPTTASTIDVVKQLDRALDEWHPFNILTFLWIVRARVQGNEEELREAEVDDEFLGQVQNLL